MRYTPSHGVQMCPACRKRPLQYCVCRRNWTRCKNCDAPVTWATSKNGAKVLIHGHIDTERYEFGVHPCHWDVCHHHKNRKA